MQAGKGAGMDQTYTILRQFADSWFLVVMFAFFVGAGLWAFRPGAKALHEDARHLPFRNDDKPAIPQEGRS